jgi:predicted enzyme related to lactoylglutathione lyase
MKIKLTNVFVDDQDKALKFYTEVLGFVKKLDFPMGKFKWLTVVSSEEPDGTQLLLEPNDNPAAKAYQQAIFRQGIRAASFFVGDIQMEYARLKKLGVTFKMEPTKAPGSTIAVLDDTCGNLIQITQLG